MMTTTRRAMLKAGAAGLALAAMGGTVAVAQNYGGTLNVGLTYEIDTMNTYSTGYLADAQHTIIEGLLAPDENAQYVPVLATEVPTVENGGIVVSEDGQSMTITYTLREGVKWHDGEDFTSEDVAFTWEAVRDPAFIAESKSGTESITSIETPDDYTVIVNYDSIVPDFASTLFTFGIMPEHILAGQDLNTHEYNELPVGTGPFMATEFARGQYVVLDRNPDYWRTAENGDQLPYLDRLVFNIVPDTNTLMTQLRSRELDMVVKTPYNQAAQVESFGGYELIVGPLLSWGHLDFNFENEFLADIAVRQAFAHAIDRNVLIQAQGGFPEAIKSIVVPIFEFYDENTPEYEFDPEEANRILDEAGYTMGEDGIRTKDGERLSFEYVTAAGSADDENIQQIIMAQLAQVGIEIVPDNRAGVALREARYNGDYDLYYGRWITSADPVYSIFYGTEGALNGQGYSNPELDAVFETVENSIDTETRMRAFSDIQRIVAEDLPTLPLTTNVSLITVTERLQNFTPNPTNMTNFVDTAEWYLSEE
ncbi:ABC transporter substrate-binding protein [Wenxinia saemankumensis]|uniref:Peptide/nickel transport system substrate-binding protein n=1 Tax=Wenxinia saemankumensis TaxID=1447782 RepID=A0A1M6BRB1_9RHOB|nr:peptide ABC transporter substrate-binding protein [Wenxinia saemankumensis]SHI51262.1 peptide/nickel transport system substrate-binding protein [Wenxinia saemankumensis]